MCGRLQALSIKTYALFDEKDKIIFEFELKNKTQRKLLDPLQGIFITFDN